MVEGGTCTSGDAVVGNCRSGQWRHRRGDGPGAPSLTGAGPLALTASARAQQGEPPRAIAPTFQAGHHAGEIRDDLQ